MKNIITYIFILIGLALVQGQIAIGKNTAHSSALLDFGTDGDKGIVLPKVKTLDTNSVAGTFYFDATKSKVKFRLANNADMDLTVKDVSTANKFDVTDAEYVKYKEEANTNGVVMGANTSTIPGVLILESANKGLALPSTTNFTNLGQPEPGTIVFDSTKGMLCIYDGEKWSFWGK